MLILYIILAVLVIVLFVGIRTMNFAFKRRPIPDALNPEVVKNTDWVKYEPNISNAAAWLKTQDVQELRVLSYDDHLLYGRFIPAENARATIIQFHGYRSHFCVDFSASMRYYHDKGYNLLMVDQRAHGKSEGKYITFGVKERYDVLSWVTYVSLMLGEDHPIFLGGLSMGATTVCMASDLDFPGNVVGVIADCGFSSPADILGVLAESQYHVPGRLAVAFLNVFSRLFCGFGLREWSTSDALSNTRLPVAFFHGLDDQLVPSQMSRKSYDACCSEKVLTEFPGAGHGTSWLKDKARYQSVLESFMEQCLSTIGADSIPPRTADTVETATGG